MVSSSCSAAGAAGNLATQTHLYSNAPLARRQVHTTPNNRHAAHLIPGRRQSLLMLTVSTVLTAVEKAKAEDIPLFGLRKKLKKVEQEAEEIVKEGIETAERGIETAERGIETAEREIFTAGKEIETTASASAAVSFGGLAQAGVVVGAEAVGVLVATSVVNGILGPE